MKYPTEGELLELSYMRLTIAKKREELQKLTGFSTSSFVTRGANASRAYTSKVERDALRRTKLEEDLRELVPRYQEKIENLCDCIQSDSWTSGQEWYLIDYYCFGTDERRARHLAGLTIKKATATREEFLRRIRSGDNGEAGHSPSDDQTE